MTNKKWIGHILSAELEQQRLFICKFRLVLYYLFICKFRHCLIGLGLVLKCAYKACGFSERPFEKITQIRKLIFILHAESIPGISNDVLKHIE